MINDLENKKWCADCKEYKSIEYFYKSSIERGLCYCRKHQNKRSNIAAKKYFKTQKGKRAIKKTTKKWLKDNGLQLKSKSIWNGSDKEYDLNDFLNNKQVVYFIGDIHGLYVKIGITSSIFSLSHRFRTIQGCNPTQLKLLGFLQDDTAIKLERRLHEQFKNYRRIGEWFILAPEITRYIKENCMKLDLANTMIGESYISMNEIVDDIGF